MSPFCTSPPPPAVNWFRHSPQLIWIPHLVSSPSTTLMLAPDMHNCPPPAPSSRRRSLGTSPSTRPDIQQLQGDLAVRQDSEGYVRTLLKELWEPSRASSKMRDLLTKRLDPVLKKQGGLAVSDMHKGEGAH